MSGGQDILKVIHRKQKDMIALLERFEDWLLAAEYSARKPNNKMNSLFSKVKSHIDTHLEFETEYLLPLLNKNTNQRTLAGLVQQRALIINLTGKMHRLMENTQNEKLGICAWDEFVDSALTLVHATFSLFHWEELAFLPSARGNLAPVVGEY